MSKDAREERVQRFFYALRAAYEEPQPQSSEAIRELGDNKFASVSWNLLPEQMKRAFEDYQDILKSPFRRKVLLLNRVANVDPAAIARAYTQSSNVIRRIIFDDSILLREGVKSKPAKTVVDVKDRVFSPPQKSPTNLPELVVVAGPSPEEIIDSTPNETSDEQPLSGSRLDQETNPHLREFFRILMKAYGLPRPGKLQPQSIERILTTMKGQRWTLSSRKPFGTLSPLLTEVHKLQDEHRGLFLLAMMTDLSWEEMATYLKMSPATLPNIFDGYRRHIVQRIARLQLPPVCQVFN